MGGQGWTVWEVVGKEAVFVDRWSDSSRVQGVAVCHMLRDCGLYLGRAARLPAGAHTECFKTLECSQVACNWSRLGLCLRYNSQSLPC
jgi:hypothetical protein